MGSPLCPMFASVFFGYDQNLLSDLSGKKPLCYSRYVDGTCTILESIRVKSSNKTQQNPQILNFQAYQPMRSPYSNIMTENKVSDICTDFCFIAIND